MYNMGERTCQKIIRHEKRMQERNMEEENKRKVQSVKENMQDDEEVQKLQI